MKQMQQLEQLSALMDDELTEEEMSMLIDNIQAHPELMTAWKHYHLIQAVLQNEINTQKDIQKELKNLHNVPEGFQEKSLRTRREIPRRRGAGSAALKRDGYRKQQETDISKHAVTTDISDEITS